LRRYRHTICDADLFFVLNSPVSYGLLIIEREEHRMDTRLVVMAAAVTMTLAGCSSAPTKPVAEQALAKQCDKSIDAGYRELNFSNANGFGGSWEYTKAASLLGAAKVQSGFGSYTGCIEKVKTARSYIKQSRK